MLDKNKAELLESRIIEKMSKRFKKVDGGNISETLAKTVVIPTIVIALQEYEKMKEEENQESSNE